MAVLTASRSVLVLVASRSNNFLPSAQLKKALHWGAFFVSVLAVLPLRAECLRLEQGFTATVAQVYDGDTVRLTNGERVRLTGINTPELGRDGQADEPMAQAARQWFVREAKGRQVYLVPGTESRDHYGRLLAHLYLPDGRLASEQMIMKGMGFALAQSAQPELLTCLFDAEQTAALSKRGVWQSAPVRAGSLNEGGFAVVEGQVTRVTPTRRGTYLDLDDHLALFVPSRLVQKSTIEWREGIEMEARGWVVDRLERQGSLRPGQQRWLLRIAHLRHLQSH